VATLPTGEAMFEGAPCALLLTDGSGLILRANATACSWLGHDEAELAGRRRMTELQPVGARLFFHTHCLPILQVQGSVAEIQVDVCNREGERLPVLVNIVRRRDGDAVFDQWALFKVSDRRAYERELLAARKTAEAALEARRAADLQLQALNAQLSMADRRKDEFLATLSHELRNPLAPMRSALDMLKLKSENSPDTPLLLAVDRQLHHLTRLVDDLMEISRITQGRMQLRRAPVELGAVVRGAVQDMMPTMEAAHHTLRLTAAAGPTVVDGDATRLSQVVLNLLANAAKYTPDGGLVELTLACEAGQAAITVRDSGIGIPLEALGTVFDMFSQLEPALERSRGGLGIGLALVRSIVELHGGSIRADSAGPGHGSTFTVLLPLASDQAGPDQAPADRRDLAPVRILVVDDNADAADMLAMALELFGCEARVAHTAAVSSAAAAGFAPQVALLDIGLPDMTGYELARRLRATPAGPGMTLIAATGWGQDKDRQEAFAAGFDHHLTKPIDVEKLRELLAGGPGSV
jgi:PAS domain S-box-containing protein